MTAGRPGSTGVDREPHEIDTTVAHAARIYDWLLGGTTNFEVDRQAAVHANADLPGGLDGARANVRANRAFLGRAVRWLAGDIGIGQFLDVGTGIPSYDNLHGTVQKIAPDSRVVYVDDPIVVAHAHSLLQSAPEGSAAFVYGDLREPEDILRQAGATLDLRRPVAVMLVAVLHFVDDENDVYEIVDRLKGAMAPGSYLVVSHGAADIDPDNMALLAARLSERSRETFVWRSHEQVTRFFDGLDLIEPGVVPVDRWRPDPATPPPEDRVTPFYGAVARKPPNERADGQTVGRRDRDDEPVERIES